MSVIQSDLPYKENALEPHISAETLFYHYEKHHRGYVDKLNGFIEGTPYDALELGKIIGRARKSDDIEILNNALQAWNHGFLWQSMSPGGGGKPGGRIREAIEKAFGNVEQFRKDFKSAALGLFGSGWAWLVRDRGDLRIITTGNAESPVGTDVTPLLTLDVWEHAYYLDYKNARNDYVDAFLHNLINWDFAATNLADAGNEEAA
jgi:superoxide dismutase, Fe-Mn family